MNVTNDTLKQLREPLPERMISWRVGSTNQDKTRGQALPYIDNRIVQNRLDDVVGPSNWTNRYEEVIVDNRLLAVRCVIGVRIGDQWVEKEDAAHLDDNAQGSRELAIKGVYSDAMKRAAVQWGIGRYLYEYQAPWVVLGENKRLQEIPRLPAHMLPAGDSSDQPGHAPASASAEESPVKAASKPTAKPEQPAQAEPVQKPVKAAAPAPAPAPAPAVAQEAPVAQDKPTESVQAEVLAPSQAAAAAQETPAAAPPANETPAESKAADAADAAAQSAQAAVGDIELPADLTAEQKALVDDLLAKIQKLPPKMIRAYITGPKGQEKLTAPARDFLLAKVAQKEAQAETA